VWFVDAAHFVHGSFLGYLVTHRMVRVSNHSYINALSVCELLVELAAAAGRRPRVAGIDCTPSIRLRWIRS
jgi:hypothetical protein